jgi:hypothetical protein
MVKVKQNKMEMNRSEEVDMLIIGLLNVGNWQERSVNSTKKAGLKRPAGLMIADPYSCNNYRRKLRDWA